MLARISEFRLPGRLRVVPIEVLVVFLISVLSVGLGVGLRDLAGDELHMLKGSPWQITIMALDPSQPFTGHLPLSFWLRELSLLVLPDQWPVAWRLHAWLAAGLTSAGLCWLARGSLGRVWATLLGVLLALHPLMLFHGQDASNYAVSALSGVGLLAGLHWTGSGIDSRRSRVLTVALCFGALNDYWFAIPAAVALLMGVLAARRSEEPEARLRAVRKAWSGPLLVRSG